ncbi:bis(5'-nucleosyl)-tetraphosphatase PrpE [Halalkalibacter akibai]|uniref:Diadenosine tetraphosphatase n=1 Tax=Halalkalibacter akibai (strain ATCC 43226 / DSM 21942 / CIP 109018 / JCM 9157 / 1139) TaxID=1236973 RepID=W4R0I6_HALA3|nr:bis(5'-nucleosyl)-tetraphosphatase PrpE [Halalkalibacter akibai]GAE37069.1 diadenosine tetraphosphatase [Halalkalibacter akibai JCM 9157]
MKFDIIGDIHGCYDELLALMSKLGYQEKENSFDHPEERKLAFVGDLTDRGPNSVEVIKTVANLVETGQAYYCPGNHCDKLYRYFLGRKVQITHGLETTVAELNGLPNKDFKRIRHQFLTLVEKSPLYQVLDDHKLVIAHAGIKSSYIGQTNKRVKTFVLYGDITGAKNPDGTPERLDWAKHHQGSEWIVYGHTPVKEPRFLHRTVNIDTGCVFGGALTALRYPEMSIEQVSSLQPYVKEKFKDFESD